jgi:hypothetical protein
MLPAAIDDPESGSMRTLSPSKGRFDEFNDRGVEESTDHGQLHLRDG